MRWTPEMLDFMRKVIPGHSEREIMDLFFDRFGIELTRDQVKNVKTKLGVYSGTHGGRFEKGHVPANKGKKQEELFTGEVLERVRKGQFKKGQMPAFTLPIGSERVNAYDYIEVKVSLGRRKKANDQWVPKQRVIWEQANGPIPAGHNVIFIDGNKRNFELDNLACVSRRDMTRINQDGIEYHDRETFQVALDYARLKNTIGDRRRSERRCKMCGELFKPRYAHQRSCNTCLEKRKCK